MKFACWEDHLMMRVELNSVVIIIFGEQYAVLGGT